MKKSFYLILAAILISFPLIAQEKGDDSDGRDYSYWNRVKVGGAGGFTPIVGMFDNAKIDKFLTGAGLPKLGTDPIYLIGGEGYGYIMFLKNVRMGGFGAAGSRMVSTLQPVTAGGSMRKEVEYEVSYGGFLIDYVQPIAYRLDIAVGASIGGGDINIIMRRDDGSFKDWNNLWNDYGNQNLQTTNYKRQLNGSFAVFNPHVTVEYTLLTWLQLRVGVGYPVMFSPEWKLDDKYEINAVPTDMKLNGYTVNAGIMFGYFGW